jgi:hypothetical protein
MSKQIIPDFTEDLVSFMIQMTLTITRLPRAPFALVPMSKKDERIFGADAKIESISPLYLQFKRSSAYLHDSTAKIITDRKNLKLNNPKVLYFELRAKDKTHADFQHNILYNLREKLIKENTGNGIYVAP